MPNLSGTFRYYMYNGYVDMRKGLFRLAEIVRTEMDGDPTEDGTVYIFMAKNRKIVKMLHFERGFFILYEKRPLQGRFKKPLYDAETKKYQISWADMVSLTEGLSMTEIRLPRLAV